MRSKNTEDSDPSKLNIVRAAARKALSDLLVPLAGFVFDAGLSATELQTLFRVAAVKSVAGRQLEIADRVNISGISASTGIPRAEISRILKMTSGGHESDSDRQQQSTNRVLSAWHKEPQYINPNGKPAALRIFGPSPTFDALVKSHGRGIPTRALLDELVRTGSVEILSAQKVRVKTLVPLGRCVSPSAIKAYGDQATDLLSAILENMRKPDQYRFISNLEGKVASPKDLPLFRKEVSSRAADFLSSMRESLGRPPLGGNAKLGSRNSQKVRVTIYYYESPKNRLSQKKTVKPRRNYDRGLE